MAGRRARRRLKTPGSSRAPSKSKKNDSDSPNVFDSRESSNTRNTSNSPNAARQDPSTSNAKNKKKSKKISITAFFEALKICICGIYEAHGHTKMCAICRPRKMNYERLHAEDEQVDSNNQALFNFYSYQHNMSEYVSLLISEALKASECAQLLALKCKTNKGFQLTIYEHWKEQNAERLLEDHELVRAVRNIQTWLKPHRFIFQFRKEVDKYEYFYNKEMYFVHTDDLQGIDYKILKFDPKYVQIKDAFLTRKSHDLYDHPNEEGATLQECYMDENYNPIFCSTVYVRKGDKYLTIDEIMKTWSKKDKTSWKTRYILLRNRYLYFVSDHQNMMMLYYETDQKFQEVLKASKSSTKGVLQTIGSVRELQFFSQLNLRRFYEAPCGGGIIVKKIYGDPKKAIQMMFCFKNTKGSDQTHMTRKQWLVAFKLAKYGRQIRINYQLYRRECEEDDIKIELLNNELLRREQAASGKQGEKYQADMSYSKNELKEIVTNFFNKSMQQRNKETTSSYTCQGQAATTSKWCEEANNPRVAMDFSYGIGRVVSDPQEAAEIARNERGGGFHRSTRYQSIMPAPEDALKFGPHLTQSYYHNDSLTREEAESMVLKNGNNGAFMVRESKNREGWLVITYVYCRKAHHHYIYPVLLPEDGNTGGIYLATCDKDTVFYDVHSLVEFHRLNRGSLLTILTESVKNPKQPDGTPPRHRRQIKRSSATSLSQPSTSRESSTSSLFNLFRQTSLSKDKDRNTEASKRQNPKSSNQDVPQIGNLSLEDNRSRQEAPTQPDEDRSAGDKSSSRI